MNEIQYLELCELADEILLAPDATPARISIPWLHIIREHPVFLKNYESLFLIKNRNLKLIRFWLSSIYSKLALLNILLKSLFAPDISGWSKILDRLSDKEIIFVSHLLNKTQFERREDPYYGDLPMKLDECGYTSLIVMLNHTKEVSSKYIERQKKDEIFRVVFPKTLGFLKELKNLRLLFEESIILKNSAKSEKNSLTKKILYQASFEALSPQSLNALRLSVQILELVKKTKAKTLITTHEGHSWERLAFYSARQANPSIKCVGYLHAPLFQKQHAVKRSLTNMYNPDKIYTSGYVQKNQLYRTESLKKTPLDVLGTNRCFDDLVESEYLRNKRVNNIYFKNTCLVIPEGIESEINILFEFSLKCALEFPYLKFIWRLHPLFSFKSLTANNKLYQFLPKNIELSQMELVQDFDRCNWVLYRGSSAVIQAVIAGLRAIYLHIYDQMKIDPLYELDDWKMVVETTQNFDHILTNSYHNEPLYQKARDYCLKVYVPFNYRTIIKRFSLFEH
jgi:hypothetical protein